MTTLVDAAVKPRVARYVATSPAAWPRWPRATPSRST